ncbi:glycosyltransferase family 69 protein [Zasmidium cellare ATCC 36951]|uniref:Glycosyltransferase family 69 protein n=1 Tax=Zasmidium cellare ATCC 36951 TaxID=1080233 RepID=A0A6A6CCD2_ZASCE|nr:glycosyltransferase family 69 protein [Zasmidium cellare ATCC 36951]KAF2164691.1 glycosyltransferase family 69 protein [Zasmidium cellare ATCC 36951]
MVAFEAKWLQHLGLQKKATGDYGLPLDKTTVYPTETGKTRDDDQEEDNLDLYDSAQLRFRAETNIQWDSSECCLIHADLAAMDSASLAPNETGIYMNPYIRVSYDGYFMPWLSFTRRFQRLYTPVHVIVNWIAERPSFNPRQYQEPGQEVLDRVWYWDEDSAKAIQSGTFAPENELQGHYEDVNRTAQPGGFCGMRKLHHQRTSHGGAEEMGQGFTANMGVIFYVF